MGWRVLAFLAGGYAALLAGVAVERARAWPVVILAVASIPLLITWTRGVTAMLRRRRLLGYTIDDLDQLEGEEFESWLVLRLEHSGLACEVTPRRGDFGVDVIVAGGGQRIGIQAKRRSRPVGNDAVMQAIAGARFHGCEAAAVVTQNRFTPAAVAQAERAGMTVLLVDRDGLPHLASRLRALAGESARGRVA